MSYTGPPTFLTPEDLARDDVCCMGAVMHGGGGCTCWRPGFDLDQARPRTDLTSEVRPTLCGDCAFKPDSPERSEDPYALELVERFYCHRGIRRPAVWRHPDGRERPGSLDDYKPVTIGGVPYRADGRPAALCGGWARTRVPGELARALTAIAVDRAAAEVRR